MISLEAHCDYFAQYFVDKVFSISCNLDCALEVTGSDGVRMLICSVSCNAFQFILSEGKEQDT